MYITYVPSNNMMGLESCWKKLEVASTHSMLWLPTRPGPRPGAGAGDRVANGLSTLCRLTCAWRGTCNRAHPP